MGLQPAPPVVLDVTVDERQVRSAEMTIGKNIVPLPISLREAYCEELMARRSAQPKTARRGSVSRRNRCSSLRDRVGDFRRESDTALGAMPFGNSGVR